MIKHILILTLLGFTFFAQAQKADFELKEDNYKFEDTNAGAILTHVYIIENTGNVPIIITDYKVVCSCTKATFPTKPILPGEKAELTITFDTKEVFYQQDRIVEFQANTKKKIKVRFKVFVNPKD